MKNLLIKDDVIGEKGQLGGILMQSFLASIKECEKLPEAIYFVNRGVFLTTNAEDKEIIAILKELESLGVAIYSCKTCLNYFKLNVVVGKEGNAKDTMNAMLKADNTLCL